ncbi:hypothetical protein PG990_001228 [Apiospora arundinis]|uniref:Uncharacterized protein n=1 Tax=Apiospora arundinis TaxID=335852 RepID=A0ABR2I1I3_9PEZI
MFDIPEAKRVRREDLYSSASSDSDDGGDDLMGQDRQVETELREKLRAQLAGLLDLDISSPSSLPAPGATTDTPAQPPSGAAVASDEGANGPSAGIDGPPASDENNPDEVAYTFRLFRDEGPSHTVVIRQGDETQAGGKAEFVVARRPRSYYVAGKPDQETMAQFKFAAVSTEYLMANAKQRKWGLEKPWRVTKITFTTDKNTKIISDADGANDKAMDEGKRTRPSKKRRVILRTRDKAKREKEEAAKKKLAEKEEHLLEKKKRLNRAKKLKRRAKERAKKGAGVGGTDEPSSRETTPE